MQCSRQGAMELPRTHVDTCWAVPFITACVTFLFAMPKTNSAVFFVLFVDVFGVNREAASWPKTIESATSNFMGFAIGAVQDKVSVFSVIAVGSIVCPVAIVAAAFTTDMAWLSVTLGFLYGTSSGLLMIGSSIYTISYFNHYRGVAAGIRFAGVSLTGVIGPPLLAELTKRYGLQGCLLITGGLTLNLIPLSMVLRNVQPVACSLFWHCCKSRCEKRASCSAVEEITAATAENMQPPTPPTNVSLTKTLTYEACNGQVETHAVKNKARENSGHIPPPEQSAVPPNGPSRVSEMRECSNSGISTQTIVVLTKPCFYIILISMVAADFIVPLLSTTIVDYALDKELPPDQSWRLVTFLSVGSMCGHLVIPLLSDRLPRGRSLMAALSFTLLSLCFIVMPQVHGFAAIGVVTFVAGVQQGYLNTLKPVLVADYLGVGSVAVSWGFMGLASLPLTCCEPMILGAFRDNGGSYDRLYRLCSVISLLAASLLALQSCLDARKWTVWSKNAPLPSTPICSENAASTQHTPR